MFLFCAACAECCVSGDTRADDVSGPRRDTVVLLHGLGRTSLSMKRLESELSKCGYEVVNVAYRSRAESVEEICNKVLTPLAADPRTDSAAKVHFVTHSLGGILLRNHLARTQIPNLGRVVMLAPPNQGSELVDSLRRCWFGRCVLGPAGRQLGTSADDLPKRLGPVDFDLGVVAGDFSWNPYFSWIIPGRDDGKVSVASTQVKGMNDFIVIHASHTWIPSRRQTAQQVAYYLQHGRFEK